MTIARPAARLSLHHIALVADTLLLMPGILLATPGEGGIAIVLTSPELDEQGEPIGLDPIAEVQDYLARVGLPRAVRSEAGLLESGGGYELWRIPLAAPQGRLEAEA